MAYLPLGIWFFGVALGMGWIMGPATSSVMGSVPEEKAGVASAMNDVTRQVGGALGTAVIGSVITSIYAAGLEDDLNGLSESARTAAEDSIGQANAIAASLPLEQGARLADSAAIAFTDAIGIGFAIAGAFAVVAAAIVRRWLPGDARKRAAEARTELPADAALEPAAS
jgi:hypothetical protein